MHVLIKYWKIFQKERLIDIDEVTKSTENNKIRKLELQLEFKKEETKIELKDIELKKEEIRYIEAKCKLIELEIKKIELEKKLIIPIF